MLQLDAVDGLLSRHSRYVWPTPRLPTWRSPWNRSDDVQSTQLAHGRHKVLDEQRAPRLLRVGKERGHYLHAGAGRASEIGKTGLVQIGLRHAAIRLAEYPREAGHFDPMIGTRSRRSASP